MVAAPYEAAWPDSDVPLKGPSPHTVRFVRAMVGQAPETPKDRITGPELSFAAAKATVLMLLALFWGWLVLRSRDLESFLGPAIAALMLLSPVVHPWYLVWVAPFCALAIGAGRRWGYALLAWPLLAWIAYLPRPEYLRDGVWQVAAWAPWAEYGPMWLGLALCAACGLASHLRCGGPGSGTC